MENLSDSISLGCWSQYREKVGFYVEMSMESNLGRFIIYAKNIEKMCAFYESFFGYKSQYLKLLFLPTHSLKLRTTQSTVFRKYIPEFEAHSLSS